VKSNKKSTAIKGIPQPFNRQAGSVRQFKPVVAQLKTPVAPPIYRPQSSPKVLQKKNALFPAVAAVQARPPVAPPAYRPDAKLSIQPKANSPLRKLPTPPPVYRPEQKSAPVLQGKSRTVGVAQTRVLQRQIAGAASRSVIQRAKAAAKKFAYDDNDLDEEGALPQQMEWEDLSEIAREHNKAATGELESRHTQAVTLDKDGRMMFYTQRWLSPMGEVKVPEGFDLEDKDYVIGDCRKNDENIHAEMLAISWYLQGKAERPVHIGVSKPVCARCSVVLSYFKIAHHTDHAVTKNWTSPWRHAELYPPKALKGKIPEIVKSSRVTEYGEDDWK
jgi:nucleic acid/nucleotide deaminase of polymorphic system toxin